MGSRLSDDGLPSFWRRVCIYPAHPLCLQLSSRLPHQLCLGLLLLLRGETLFGIETLRSLPCSFGSLPRVYGGNRRMVVLRSSVIEWSLSPSLVACCWGCWSPRVL